MIRVVLVNEDLAGKRFSEPIPTPPSKTILDAFANRATIEQDFHDVKEVWAT
jgi:hypothetical protein